MLNLLEHKLVTSAFDERMRTVCSTESDPFVEFLKNQKNMQGVFKYGKEIPYLGFGGFEAVFWNLLGRKTEATIWIVYLKWRKCCLFVISREILKN